MSATTAAKQGRIFASGCRLFALRAAMRKDVGMRPLDSLIAGTTGEGIPLRPAVELPVEIRSAERNAEFDVAEGELARVLVSRRKR